MDMNRHQTHANFRTRWNRNIGEFRSESFERIASRGFAVEACWDRRIRASSYFHALVHMLQPKRFWL
ncbi:hypothetical protein L596_018624 [Steinernema carpocapsae]|uniref:Uncharacterized protein n=1 Tax=Steinernema carpocapsae TaxID=34508 RepID=A0A4U5N5X9_STECR|nr:hypothetical protein L596_018624 [Steinernema carpocapsae]